MEAQKCRMSSSSDSSEDGDFSMMDDEGESSCSAPEDPTESSDGNFQSGGESAESEFNGVSDEQEEEQTMNLPDLREAMKSLIDTVCKYDQEEPVYKHLSDELLLPAATLLMYGKIDVYSLSCRELMEEYKRMA